MKERPILFSGAMVRALLDGRKTQTRRVVKWPKDMEIDHAAVERLATSNDTYLLDRCPYGVPSDRLWVRETTYDVERNGYVGPVFVESEDGEHAHAWGWGDPDDPDQIEPHELRKRPAIHMSRAMARIILEVTCVRVERLQDIQSADAGSEGVEQMAPCRWRDYSGIFEDGHINPVASFASLWDSLNAVRGYGWDVNPWVWVIEFRRIN